MSGEPDWLVVGADVATVSSNRHSPSVDYATVARFTTRDVVLSDGQRFNRQRLVRNEGGDWGWSVTLLPADDPYVDRAADKIREQRNQGRARAACDKFTRGQMSALDVILALGPLTDRPDAVAALADEVTS